MEEKSFIEARRSITYTLEKKFLQLQALKVWESFLLKQSNKSCSVLGLYHSSLLKNLNF